MSTFIFVRHGESTAVDYIAGRTAVSLSEKGRKEAEITAAALSKLNIDRLIASPLKRTQETAGYISRACSLEIETMDDFIEVDFGDWTGKSFEELKKDKLWNVWRSFRSGYVVPNGENLIQAQARMVNGLNKLKNKYPDETIVIVSHGDPIRTVFLYYLGMPIDMVLRIKINTASVSILNLMDDNAAVLCYNHTPDLNWLPFKL